MTNDKAQMSNQTLNPGDEKDRFGIRAFGFCLSFGFWYLEFRVPSGVTAGDF